MLTIFNECEASVKKYLLALLTLLIPISTYASPGVDFYVNGFFGVNFVGGDEITYGEEVFNPGGIISGSAGLRLFQYIRIEGEVAYRTNNFDELFLYDKVHMPATGYRKMVTGMGNAIIEFPQFSKNWIPYVGGGFGGHWSRVKCETDPFRFIVTDYAYPDYQKRVDDIAYQGIAGLIFTKGDRMQVGIEYRYLDGSQIPGNHSLGLSLRGYF